MSFNEVTGKVVCELPRCHKVWYARKRNVNGRFICPIQCISCKSYNFLKKRIIQ